MIGGMARWIVPLSASLALHAAFFGFFTFAAPGPFSPETRAARGAAGMTVTLRRIETGPAAPAKTAETPKESAAPTAAVPKQAAAKPKPKPKPKRAVLPAKPKPAVREPPAPMASYPSASSAASHPSASAPPAGPTPPGAGTPKPGANPLSPGGAEGAVAGVGKGDGAGKIFELSDLKVLRRVKPDYPVIARKRKEEGTVTLLITLDGGNVSSVKVEKTSGFPTLDEAAAAAVRKWRFEPGKNAARMQARVPVTFKLKL